MAQREAVSGNFLVQILNDLRRAGLIDSRRGKAGGYLLARPANTITLRQVVEAVDPILLQCGVSTEGESGAAVRVAWEKVSENLRDTLDRISLDTMVSGQSAPMFYI